MELICSSLKISTNAHKNILKRHRYKSYNINSAIKFWGIQLLSKCKYNILFHLMLTCPSFAQPADWAREDVKLSCTKWTKC